VEIAKGSRRSAGNIQLATNWIYKNNPTGREWGEEKNIDIELFLGELGLLKHLYSMFYPISSTFIIILNESLPILPLSR
jgi:hypothetical protein